MVTKTDQQKRASDGSLEGFANIYVRQVRQSLTIAHFGLKPLNHAKAEYRSPVCRCIAAELTPLKSVVSVDMGTTRLNHYQNEITTIQVR